MDSLDLLTKRVQQASALIQNLKKENVQLRSELDLLRSELRDQQQSVRENQALKRVHDKLRSRLERLNARVEAHLKSELDALTAGKGGGNGQPH